MRRSRSPFSTAASIDDRPRHSRSRSARMRSLSVAISSLARRAASPMPTIWCVASVPERNPRSCPPPWICGSILTRGFLRTYSAPMPLGPYILCAVIVSRSTFSVARSIGSLPAACTASQWNTMFFARHSSPISAIGWITPISLLTIMIDTRMVSGRIAASSLFRSTRPFSSTSR